MERLVIVESFVGDPGVVGRATRRCRAQFVEHLARVGLEAVCRLTEADREFGEDLELAAGAVGNGNRLATAKDPALQGGHGALFFCPLQNRQHHVGQLRCLRQQEVVDNQHLQRFESLDHVPRPRRGDGQVRSVHHQHLGSAGLSE